MSLNDDLRQIVTSPVAGIPDVIAVMERVHALLPDADGLKWFNSLYLSVTRAVRDDLSPAAYADPAWINALDVVFAGLYFAAVANAANPAAAPPAWRPLLEARNSAGVARIQFALAGMNAHINRDLPLAIDQTYQATGGRPSHADVHYADFNRVNAVLADVEGRVKQDLLTGALRDIDRVSQGLADVVAMWDVRVAREAAWVQSETLWHLAALPPARDAYFATLDRTVALAGRGLLVHVT